MAKAVIQEFPFLKDDEGQGFVSVQSATFNTVNIYLTKHVICLPVYVGSMVHSRKRSPQCNRVDRRKTAKCKKAHKCQTT